MKDKLDELIKDWDAGELPKFNGSEKLKSRVLDRLSTGEGNMVPEDQETCKYKGWLTGGIAAAILLLTLNLIILYSKKPHNNADEIASLSIYDLDELKKVSQEVDYMFPEGVRWISKDGDKLEIKTGGEQLTSKKILIRYVILEKKAEKWITIHKMDVVTRPGESIELDGTTKGHLWTLEVGNGIYALDSKLKFLLKGGYKEINFSSGVENKKSTEVIDISSKKSQFKIYQILLEV